MKFRKKPVVIEAIQWKVNPIDPSDNNGTEMKNFTGQFSHLDNFNGLLIFTLEGSHRAAPGDWVIKGVKGEFYPCKPDIFAMTYELAEPVVGES